MTALTLRLTATDTAVTVTSWTGSEQVSTPVIGIWMIAGAEIRYDDRYVVRHVARDASGNVFGLMRNENSHTEWWFDLQDLSVWLRDAQKTHVVVKAVA